MVENLDLISGEHTNESTPFRERPELLFTKYPRMTLQIHSTMCFANSINL